MTVRAMSSATDQNSTTTLKRTPRTEVTLSRADKFLLQASIFLVLLGGFWGARTVLSKTNTASTQELKGVLGYQISASTASDSKSSYLLQDLKGAFIHIAYLIFKRMEQERNPSLL
jgi:hypothetical protein